MWQRYAFEKTGAEYAIDYLIKRKTTVRELIQFVK